MVRRFPSITIEPVTEHLSNEDRKRAQQKRDGSHIEETKPQPKKAQEYTTHTNVGHSNIDHKALIASNPELATFSVIRKNQATSSSSNPPQQPSDSSSSDKQAFKKSRG